ncbi:MAG: hypothetical protein FWH26_08150, partial [Oscillospiraceae bacterium]|nr:hypothetical protein [Oscillospiraceae bacterium]
MKRNRGILCFFVTLALLSLTYLSAAAIAVDGNVGDIEWIDYPFVTLLEDGKNHYCGIQFARLRHAADEEKRRVIFGLTGQAKGVDYETDLGISLRVQGREIARYRQSGASYEEENYHAFGAYILMEPVSGGYFSLELELGCKNEAAFRALEELVVQLIDPSGEPSQELCYPVRAAAPATTQTTQKTTATKPATESTAKESTTRPATSAAATTAKATAASSARYTYPSEKTASASDSAPAQAGSAPPSMSALGSTATGPGT